MKPRITLTLGAGIDQLTIEDKGVTRVFDRNALTKAGRNKLRRMMVAAWKKVQT